MQKILCFFLLFGGVYIFNLTFLRHYLKKYWFFCDHWKENFLKFLLQSTPESSREHLNESTIFWGDTPQHPHKGTNNLKGIFWTTSGEPQVGSKVPGTHILGAISHYFRIFNIKDPVSTTLFQLIIFLISWLKFKYVYCLVQATLIG